MEKLKFKKEINASAEKVWEVLLGVSTYPLWTAVFAAGSTVETDWKKGSKAYFSDGKGHGMVSRIEENIPNQFISIKHLGEFKDGKEDLNKDWGEAFENYTLETVEVRHCSQLISKSAKTGLIIWKKPGPRRLKKLQNLQSSKLISKKKAFHF